MFTISSQSLRYLVAPSPLGHLAIATNSGKLCALLFAPTLADGELQLAKIFPKNTLIKGGDKEQQILSDTLDYLSGNRQSLPHVGFSLTGTPFQRQIWDVICAIPSGQTRTYSDIAKELGKPLAVRAVARACGANKIAVFIPCHRVIGKDDAITGYRWGVERKRRLLDMEKRSHVKVQRVVQIDDHTLTLVGL